MSPNLGHWRGKIALVTGASSGIGAAVAVALGELGMRVAITGRNVERLQLVSRRVCEAGGEALLLRGDQTHGAANIRFFKIIKQRWGSVDVLVNSAAMRGGTSLLETNWREIHNTFELNVGAALICMREAAVAMRRKRHAAIINVSSMAGHRVLPGTPALYAATKHALRVLTDGIRAELTQKNPRVKVTLISPGLVDTPWHQQPEGLLKRNGRYPYAPLAPHEIATAVLYVLGTPCGVQVADILLRSSAQPL